MGFIFRNGRYHGLDAAIVGEELTRIYNEHGALSAQVVVDAARPEDAPLHPAFEWDDSTAAEAYRREQARTLIKVVRVRESEDKPSAPAFLNVTTLGPAAEDGEVRSSRGYHPLAVVLADSDKLASVMSDFRSRVRWFESELRVLGGPARVAEAAGQLALAIDEELETEHESVSV
jgi:hypothetical protein